MWFWLPALVAKKITVISNFSKKELSEIVPFAKNKIIVIPNPVNSAISYTPKDFNGDRPIILHLGTKDNKNLERTILALEGINCTLDIIGELTTSQMQLLKKHDINFMNSYHLPFSKIIEHYQNADIVCFASLYEGFGMPIIEAQKVGRVLLTSKIEPLINVAGKGAHFVNPHRVDDIRNGIKKIITDPNYRKRLIKSGLDNVKRFDIENITKQYLEVYEEIISNKP